MPNINPIESPKDEINNKSLPLVTVGVNWIGNLLKRIPLGRQKGLPKGLAGLEGIQISRVVDL
jgi:hypothetical protein